MLGQLGSFQVMHTAGACMLGCPWGRGQRCSSGASLCGVCGSQEVSAAFGADTFHHFPGVHFVFDTAFARNFSLLESQKEFVQRFREQANSREALPVLASACPGVSMAAWLFN
jgi:hypothetical protein